MKKLVQIKEALINLLRCQQKKSDEKSGGCMDKVAFLKCINSELKKYSFVRIKSQNNYILNIPDQDISILVGLQKSRFINDCYFIELGISFFGNHIDNVPQSYYKADIRKRLRYTDDKEIFNDEFLYSAWDEKYVTLLIEKLYYSSIKAIIDGGKETVVSMLKNKAFEMVTKSVYEYLGLPEPEDELTDHSILLESGGIICICEENYIKNKNYYDEYNLKGGKVCVMSMNGKKARML